MRILIATPLYPPDIGGPAKYAKEITKEFCRQGHKAQAIAYGSIERSLPPGVRHIVYWLRIMPVALHCDAIVALDTWSVGLPAYAAAVLLKKTILVRVGGDIVWESYVGRTGEQIKLSQFYEQYRHLTLKERFMGRGIRMLGRRAVLVFTTQWQKDIWNGPYDLTGKRTYIIENEYPEPQKVLPPKGNIFIAAGRDISLKNKKTLHKAFALAKRQHPDIALDERILPPKEHRARMARCHAVIVSSVSEVNSNTVIEAAALGKPFIMTNDNGGRNKLAGAGIFVDTANAGEIVEAIDTLLDEKVYAAYVSATGRIKSHSWSEIASEFITILNSL